MNLHYIKHRPEALLSVVFLLGIAVGVAFNEYFGSKSDCQKLQTMLENNLDMVEDIQEAIRDAREKRCRLLDIDRIVQESIKNSRTGNLDIKDNK